MRPNPQETADLVTFTGEIPNGKLHLCEVILRKGEKNIIELWGKNMNFRKPLPN